jgi:hypothetical protein
MDKNFVTVQRWTDDAHKKGICRPDDDSQTPEMTMYFIQSASLGMSGAGPASPILNNYKTLWE